MFYFVKVRIDVQQLPELGRVLRNGELDTSFIKMTYCLEDDPAVGVNIWEADNNEHFEKVFAPHKQYFKEILEITPVILPTEAQELLMKKM